MSENGETEFGWIMPFVVCQTNGGPYEDEAFIAGARFAKWDMLLKFQPTMHQEYEPAALVPQLDLLAMHLGYKMTTEPWEQDPSWVLVRMSFGGDPEDGTDLEQ